MHSVAIDLENSYLVVAKEKFIGIKPSQSDLYHFQLIHRIFNL